MTQLINIGANPNDGSGDPLRVAFDKCNQNFIELLPLGNAIEYRFTVATTEPPASSEIRLDHQPQASSTKLWASQTTSSGINIKQFLSAATTGSQIIIQDKIDNTNYIKLNVTGSPVDKGGYWEFPISVITSGGNLPSAAVLVSVTAAIGGGGGSSVTPSDTAPLVDGTAAPGISALYSRGDHVHPTDTSRAATTYVDSQDALKAPLASPTFTGDPRAPTPSVGDNDTSIATTAFVTTAVGGAAVRYDSAQSLTAAQQTQARSNIWAAPFDAMSYSGMQINGSMEVSQEKGYNNPIVVPSGTATYLCDGWQCLRGGTMAISAASYTGSPISTGFLNVSAVTVQTAQASLGAGDYAFVLTNIEAYRMSRLAWGTSNAQPITIGFWTQHARTGTYTGVVRNNALSRVYAFSYTQNAANTSQYNTVTIPGCLDGPWELTNLTGLTVIFAMAAGSTLTAPSLNTWLSGTNYVAGPGQVNAVAATSDVFRLTGVVVLPGTQAPTAAQSPLIMRPYDQELLTCKRYWHQVSVLGGGYKNNGNSAYIMSFYAPAMRATPTITVASSSNTAVDGTPTRSASVENCLANFAPTSSGGYVYNEVWNLDARL